MQCTCWLMSHMHSQPPTSMSTPDGHMCGAMVVCVIVFARHLNLACTSGQISLPTPWPTWCKVCCVAVDQFEILHSIFVALCAVHSQPVSHSPSGRSCVGHPLTAMHTVIVFGSCSFYALVFEHCARLNMPTYSGSIRHREQRQRGERRAEGCCLQPAHC
jgi:hypothetical protein